MQRAKGAAKTNLSLTLTEGWQCCAARRWRVRNPRERGQRSVAMMDLKVIGFGTGCTDFSRLEVCDTVPPVREKPALHKGKAEHLGPGSD